MSGIVPKAWMPKCNMKRIHLHWTAGAHSANSTDKRAYHILVEGDGSLVQGDFSIAANEVPSRGKYAAHTGSANTKSIGVSVCCMAGAKESPFYAGKYPMTDVQWKAAIKVIAELSEFYDIHVTPTTILTHAEVEPNLNIKQKQKWDIVRLPFDPSLKGYKAVGDEMRVRVADVRDSYAEPEDDNDAIMPDDMVLPRYRVVGVSPSRLNFRRSPGGEKVGALGERSIIERLGVIGEWWQVRTRLGYIGYVHSAYLSAMDTDKA